MTMSAPVNKVQLVPPYLVFVGDQQDPSYCKTGFGIVHWRPELVAGQLRFGEQPVDLGVPELALEDAVEAGARSLLIGVAPVGGRIPEAWWMTIIRAAELGLDIVSGLHGRLADVAELAAAAKKSGAALVDVRVPPKGIPVGTGRKRSGKRVLMVGTDCAVGKKYTALSLTAALQAIGAKATFRATGQTGIMIAGEGIPIDAVVADFVAGAAELLSPDNDADHWDVIEGQGSVFHPGYSGVSLGLLHGSQPDAVVVCHDASRTVVLGWPDYAVPTIADCIELTIALGRRVNAAVRCVGVSVNTSGLAPSERASYLERLSGQTGLPCVDPVAGDCSPLARALAA